MPCSLLANSVKRISTHSVLWLALALSFVLSPASCAENAPVTAKSGEVQIAADVQVRLSAQRWTDNSSLIKIVPAPDETFEEEQVLRKAAQRWSNDLFLPKIAPLRSDNTLLELTARSDRLSAGLLKDKDAHVRSLTLIVFLRTVGRCYLVDVAPLLDDKAKTLKHAYFGSYGQLADPYLSDQTIDELARRQIARRLDISTHSDVLKNAEALRIFLAKCDTSRLPSEWVNCFRELQDRGGPRAPHLTRLFALPGDEPAIIAAIVAAFVPREFEEEQIVSGLKAVKPGRLQKIVTGKWHPKGAELEEGPNEKGQHTLRRWLLRRSPLLFAVSDADWLMEAAKPGEPYYALYVVAAARIPGKQSAQLLERGLRAAASDEEREHIRSLWESWNTAE